MIRRFTSGPKPSPRVRGHHLDRVGALGSVPVADAVVAREVRGRLRGSDQVVGGQGVLGVRERRLAHLGAQCREPVHRGAHRVAHARLDALAERLRDDAHPETVDAVIQAGEVVGHVLVQARGVAVVLARHRPEQQRGIADAPRERSHRVERRRERDQPVTGHQPVRRLHPHHAAERRRLAHRPARVRAERPHDLAGGHGGGAARRWSRRAPVPGPTGCGRVRTPSSRWTSPSRTRRSWSCPSARCRAPDSRAHAVHSYGGM